MIAAILGFIALVLLTLTVIVMAIVSQLRKMVYVIADLVAIEHMLAELDDDGGEERQSRLTN